MTELPENLRGPYHVGREGDDYFITNGNDFYLFVDCLATSHQTDKVIAEWVAAQLNKQGESHDAK